MREGLTSGFDALYRPRRLSGILAHIDKHRPGKGIDRYRQRWKIEMLFGTPKSRRFDLVVTHLRAPRRVQKLVGLLPVAFIWAHLAGL